MRFGLMLRAQFPLGDDLSIRFRELIEQVRLVEKLGFASATVASHYAATGVSAFQQIPLLSRISAETESLLLNAGVVLLPLHKPLDIAEQLATIDVMSGGRLIFGTAIGYRDVEFHAFGTTRRDRVARFEQNLEAVKRLWVEDVVTMTGSHFQLNNAHCSIKPVQQPHPPIWIGADADAAVRRAARLGDTWYINPHVRIATIDANSIFTVTNWGYAGNPFPANYQSGARFLLLETETRHTDWQCPTLPTSTPCIAIGASKMHFPAMMPSLVVTFTTLLAIVLLGSADDVAEKIIDLNQRTQANHLVMSMYWAGMPQGLVTETMHRLAQDVFPKVQSALA